MGRERRKRLPSSSAAESCSALRKGLRKREREREREEEEEDMSFVRRGTGLVRPLGRAHLCPTIETSAACESVSVFARSKAEETAVTPTTTAPATTNSQGAAFPNDLRSTSGIGKGDNLETHTSKWLSEGEGPMEMINRVPPKAVDTKIVACRGGQFQLGHPVEFLKVYGTTEAEPAVCKYCGLRYYHCAGAH